MGDAVGLLAKLAIAPGRNAARGAHARPVAPAALVDGLVEQLDRAIELFRELQFGQLEQELRLLFGWWQMLLGETVDVGSAHASSSFSSSRAMMSCWTSVAPS